MGWQYVIPAYQAPLTGGGSQVLSATFGLDKPDALKRLRIQVFSSLLGWTLGRLLEQNSIESPLQGSPLTEWGESLRNSELFDSPGKDPREHWKDQFLPFLWFTVPDWRA
jgi:hypothetical protein